MVLIADLADEVFADVEAEFPDAVLTVNLWEITEGTFDSGTGSRPRVENDMGTMKAVGVTEKPIADQFPDYVVGPGDQLFFLRGDVVPVEGWELRGAKTYVIRAVQDILANGTIFNVVVR